MIYQVQIMLRTLDAQVSWEELGQTLREQLTVPDIIIDSTGAMQCRYYFLEEEDIPSLEEQVRSAVYSVMPEENNVRFAVSSKALTPNEISSLREGPKASVFDRDWFKEDMANEKRDDLNGRGAAPVPVSTPATVEGPVRVTPQAPDVAQAASPSVPENAEVGSVDLVQLVAKVQDIQDALLSKVRGQYHAVTELVQGVFESELFTKNAPERKGPLATFLFMGPSGVGKTYLAKEFGRLSDRPVLTVDMSEYSDNLSNLKFNGDHGEDAVVTGFVRQSPNAILIFDEIEKAHINTIHLFLQILDAGQLRDQKVGREVSFADTIIIMTTNAGSSLYDSTDATDLSGISRQAMLAALRTEKKPGLGDETMFPESITTRMANGHVILFNHLEPYALMEIVQDELSSKLGIFSRATGAEIIYDQTDLASLVLYAAGASADARTLRGLARNIIVKEIQDICVQMASSPDHPLEGLQKLHITVDKEEASEEIRSLFHQERTVQAVVFTDSPDVAGTCAAFQGSVAFHITTDEAELQKHLRNVTDFVILDPFTGHVALEREPNDIEDIQSAGMKAFDYMREYFPEIPVYILDHSSQGATDFSTLLGRGARSVLPYNGDRETFFSGLQEIIMNALIGNAVYRLRRSQKYLCYNCAQYLGRNSVEICFTGMRLKTAVAGEDMGDITHRGENSALHFEDIVGCKDAKATLQEYCDMLDDPEKCIMAGKRLPKGLLLYGAPGTGKTMLAKAMANESNAMFLAVSATSFFGSLVGETEKNIRDLFHKARKYAPSVIFIDEVDAIARRRTGGIGTSHNEDALNTFLAEMDGFSVDEKRPVFILAATNYDIEGDGGRVLDTAFVRRFDRKINIPLPDTEDREELFRRCLQRHNIHFGAEHDEVLHNIAQRSGGMSNADIDMMVEMYVRSLKDDAPTGAGLMDALDEFRFGSVKDHDQDDLLQTSYHEAGHTLVCWNSGVKPLFLTVISRGDYGGYMETSMEGKGKFTYEELKDTICRSLAGRAAELEVYGERLGLNTGASSDLSHARSLAKACLYDFGMGPTLYSEDIKDDAETLLQEQLARARSILSQNRATLDALAHQLMNDKCIDTVGLERFFAAHPLVEEKA